ncbi:hypothetical protein ML462_09955 [Gramella lutea]|uniref:Heat-shock protein Hsp90 n=1 Tax=Christiangramia lutea TaxID=1607951 RepID=A0A9X1V4D8_9FLAO|nr:DUF6503 family protein [Christiangramia lutea]MCH4823491.1 hypothetical protein [Christiangramia lutea]
MKKLIFFFAALIILGCKQQQPDKKIPVEPNEGIGDGAQPPNVFSFSENIEEAHNKAAFMNKEAISFDIKLEFGGKTRLEGKVSMTTNSTKVRLDKSDGSSIIYDGKEVFITPKSANAEGARFDIFTWQYFFAMPFKLTDPGTVWEEQEKRVLDSTNYETAKLTFQSDVGDSPDDWYVVYKDLESNRLKAAAYIVTFGKDKSKAEEDPHAIVYSDFKTVENVSFATSWDFHNWNEKEGFGKKLGEANISNLKFFKPEKAYFEAPTGAKPVTK